MIVESRPLSRDKRWVVQSIIRHNEKGEENLSAIDAPAEGVEYFPGVKELESTPATKIISESLRCTDVFTIDNNTALVIITDTDQDDAKIIIERIEERCKEEPLLKGYQITYEKEML